MNGLLEYLAANSGTAIVILLALAVALSVAVFRLSAQVARIHAKWRDLLSDTTTGNLELLLKDHLTERLRLQAELEKAELRIAELEKKVATAKRHLGFVRFDAFDDVGGAQSFALALYDDHGDGAVLNGLIGRADARVYCKPLVAGRSDRALSEEEQRAVDDATSSAPKAVVTR